MLQDLNSVLNGAVLARTLMAIAIAGLIGLPLASLDADEVDFNRDIRSILSDKCFLCHGPADSTREADLRLDLRDEAIASGAIVPGEAEASELVARIISDDSDMVMPPPETGKSLTPAEIELLTKWIQQDAPYDAHWAFLAPRRPELPKVQQADWPRNAIDYFVLARLESKGMSPSSPASPGTLTRRLSLDLTGLPPTIAQLDRVESDPTNAQFQQLADELFKSEHFGERWGRWWLDAARYADSAGYEKDLPRQVWFYRDWVIDAMNRDMAYDEFLIQQIAGDLLPGAGQSERVATGFLRNSMTNEEGGANPEQFRVEGMFDRMDAVGKSILGITTQCAQCHTHKYDPLTQREYYEMFAAMNDFHEACISVFTPEQAQHRDRVLAEIESIESRIRDTTPDWKSSVSQWADSLRPQQAVWRTMKPTETPFDGEKFFVMDDGSILSESYAPTKSTNRFSLTSDIGTITAVRFDALQHPQLPRGGPGRSIDGTGALTEFQLKIEPENGGQPLEVKFVRAISDAVPPTQALKPQYREKDAKNDKRVVGPVEYAIDGDENTAWTTDLGPGRSNVARHAIFIPESPVVVDGKAKLTFTMVQKHGGWNSDDNQNFIFGRYRFSITDDDVDFDQTIDTGAESCLDLPASEWSPHQWNTMFSQWRSNQKSLAAENETIESIWSQYPETASQLVVQSRHNPRTTFVYARGDFLSPKDAVSPATPEFLHSMPGPGEPERLRFARWLASRESPTTARVIVNRIWQAYFGNGLVATPEDFGFQSQPPTHPQLLDFLAMELVDSGWSLKHIHRLIVDSATYRQSSKALPEAWRSDPRNKWLGRGPRMRAEAEMVRDIALSASGLLNPTVGGPTVYPPAPAFLYQPPTSYGPKTWNTVDNQDQYRRSVYVHQYRSVPYPPLQAFDAPKGDAANVKRAISNSPIQSLVLLNEPQFVAAARALATRVIREADSDQARIIRAFRLCTSRRPDETEVKLLVELLESMRTQMSATPEEKRIRDLKELLGVEPSVCWQLTGVAGEELASWITVCRAILNLDETITKS